MKSEGRKQKTQSRKQETEEIRQKAVDGERIITSGQIKRFALVAGLVCMIGLSFAQNGIARKSDPSLTFRVRVYNYAQASAAMVAGAEREAGRILSDAGVQAIWLDCLAVDSSTEPQSLCHESFGATAVELRILAKPAENQFRDTVFGFANVPTLANVYYQQAVRLAHGDDADFEATPILGCAMAHEIGHLLLGSNSHSDSGIMRGQWERKDVQQALMGRRLFTSAQAKLIRAEVRERGVPKKAGTASSRNGIARESDPGLTFKVGVYNYAQASPETLAGAEREAGTILGLAGVRVVWMDCRTPESTTDSQNSCQKSLGPADVELRILAQPIRNMFQGDPLGYAIAPEMANVYYQKAMLFVGGKGSGFAGQAILGCVMAHEIGHLLLGSNSHSDSGVMRATWEREDMLPRFMGRRLFTPAQAKLIRAEVGRREASLTASALSTPSLQAK